VNNLRLVLDDGLSPKEENLVGGYDTEMMLARALGKKGCRCKG
jgi:hypothetical protein